MALCNYDLRYFNNPTTDLNGGNFRPSDQKRFFRVHPQDSLTTVALVHLEIEYETILAPNYYSITTWHVSNLITRSSKIKGHAEVQAMEEIKKVITSLFECNNYNEVVSVSIVMNITYSPCQECLEKLYNFFYGMPWYSGFHLRFAYLYHNKGERGHAQPVQRLADWLIAMRGVTQCFVEIDAIQVAQELQNYSYRVPSLWDPALQRRQNMDKEMMEIVKKIYTKEAEIMKENQQVCEAMTKELMHAA